MPRRFHLSLAALLVPASLFVLGCEGTDPVDLPDSEVGADAGSDRGPGPDAEGSGPPGSGLARAEGEVDALFLGVWASGPGSTTPRRLQSAMRCKACLSSWVTSMGQVCLMEFSRP